MSKSPRWVVWEQQPDQSWAIVARMMFRESAKLYVRRHECQHETRMAIKREGEPPPSRLAIDVRKLAEWERP
jgi:hypothetical protein